MKISVVINVVKEEVDFLPRVLNSVKNLASEIVLIDMTGGDEVKKLAKKHKANVYKHKFIPYVEPVRNFGLSKASGDWILILDPDEEVSSSLARQLKKIVNKPAANYYRLPRKNIIFGRWLKHSRWWPDYNIRFFRKGKVSWNEMIHAVPITIGQGMDLNAEETNAIVHYHYDSIEQYLERMNRYTSQHAKLKLKDGYKFSALDLIRKPSGEFLSRFFAGEGYKDGVHGLAIASLQAVSELVMYLKIWQTNKFKEDSATTKKIIKTMRDSEKEFVYWQANTLVKQMPLNFLQRFKRKFKGII